MSYRITGREALSLLDSSLLRLRKKMSDAIAAHDSLETREAEVRGEQVDAYRELAEMRIDALEAGETGELDRLHTRALKLLGDHTDLVARDADALAAAEQEISELETARTEAAQLRDQAIEAYEDIVATVADRLREDPSYKALVKANDDAEAIAARADQKLAVAIDEREQKGEPYLSDPLFSYLWNRKFRTPDYEAGHITRMLDGWVARLCKYDDAYQNFRRLNDIPAWLETHAQAQREKAKQSLATLEAAEAAALDDAGATSAQDEVDKLQAQVADIDTKIERAEDDHIALVNAHEQLLAGEDGPAKEARRLLEQGLRNMSFGDLRQLAAETVSDEDDELVDELVKLRTEELSLEVEAERVDELPKRLKAELGAVELLRRKFKSARMDSEYAFFKPAIIEDTLAGLSMGSLSVDSAFRRLRSAVKRREPRTRQGFGGARRSQTLGLPEVLGDVAWEVLREVSRHKGGRGGFPDLRGGSSRGRRTSFPTRRRSSSPRRSSRGARKRGGFKTGGGF